MEHVVGMGDYVTADREDDIIWTFSLASCVGVTVYSPVKKVAGMIHIVLPDPLSDRDRVERPSYFAQTGIPLLINAMCQKYGCIKNELHIQMYGGVDSRVGHDIYNVGRKNIDAVKHALISMGLTLRKADLRGNDSRTLSMDVKTGDVKIYRQPIFL